MINLISKFLTACTLSMLSIFPAFAGLTQCFYDSGDDTLSITYVGYAQYFNGGLRPSQYGVLSDWNWERPDGNRPCVNRRATALARGPLTVQSGPDLVEVTFYDVFNQTSSGAQGQCSNREGWDRWKFSGGGVLLGSSGVFCLALAEQNKNLSLIVSTPTSKEIRPAGTTGNSIAELVAKVVTGTSPVAGVAIQFTTDATANSGGHDHDVPPRPKGALVPASGTTDANGEVKFRFNATQISGVHTITATCNDCVNKTAVEKVTVKVPGLLNIFTLPFRDPNWAYPGVGQTDNHSDNHYLTVAAAARMLDISRKYQKIWPTAPKLTLNDASLVWGGKFDIDGTWERNTQRHNEHRIGDNVDVRANTALGAVPPKIRAAVFRWLRDNSLEEDNIPAEFVIDSVNPLHEGIGKVNEHFHLRLGN